jgi:hypothetical protein
MKTVLPALILAFAAAAAPVLAVDFIVPGISLESVSLAPGARVAYLVVSQSFGSSDSSYVELAILSRGGGEVRLELSTAPYPPRRAETLPVRLRFSERAVSVSSAGEFRECIREIRVREGSKSFREPTAAELDDLAIEDLFIRRSGGEERRALAAATVAVPAGSFLCSGVETARRDARTVTLGGVAAERVEEETTRIWISSDVPLWGLVKSRMERRSTIARMGSSGAAPRITITESTLLSFKKPRGK